MGHLGREGEEDAIEIEGRLDIFRLDRDSDPQPWTYRLTFIPTTTARPVGGRCCGENEVIAVLKRLDIQAEIIAKVVKAISAGESPQIPHVHLRPEEIDAHGL